MEADDCMADWTQEETEVPGDNTHLWEESWDDDDTSEDFSAQLKYAAPLDMVDHQTNLFIGRS